MHIVNSIQYEGYLNAQSMQWKTRHHQPIQRLIRAVSSTACELILILEFYTGPQSDSKLMWSESLGYADFIKTCLLCCPFSTWLINSGDFKMVSSGGWRVDDDSYPAHYVICHELQKFYGGKEEVKIRCKTSGSPQTCLTYVTSKQPIPKKKFLVLGWGWVEILSP